MTYSKQRLREVTALKREAVRRIQTDIGEIHPSPTRKYIHEFNEEFQSFESVCSHDEILTKACQANLVWIGDYHALSASQNFVAELLKEIVERKRDVALAVEPVFARNQKLLDLWMDGKMSEQEFLDRIHYYEEWGCDWEAYKDLFNTARSLGAPVYAVDCHPRNDMRSIGRRDLGVARRIARLMERNPAQTLVVVFGESHLASRHLPGRVQTILQRKEIPARQLTILQNVDALYWQLEESGLGEQRAVRVREGLLLRF